MLGVNPFSALTSKIYGGLSIALILAIGVLMLTNRATVKAKDAMIANQGTTIQALERDVTTARNNSATLSAGIADQNASIDRETKALEALTEQSKVTEAAIRSGNAAGLAAVRVAMASVPQGGDPCKRADALINAVVMKGTVK